MGGREDVKDLTIGQVAKRAGVGVETVRFYEREGLIEEPPRAASGYRQYPEAVIARLRFIRRAKELGFSLREVRDLIVLRLDATADRAEVRRQAEEKIREVEAKILDLERIGEALLRLTQACRREGTASECPILEALDTTEEDSRERRTER